jgi:hypothetical protein
LRASRAVSRFLKEADFDPLSELPAFSWRAGAGFISFLVIFPTV